MRLLIDDCRDLMADVIARNSNSGKRLLEIGGWSCLLLDHDLGNCESGYEVLVWGLERGLIPKEVHLVTSNPVGRMNMKAALENAGYKSPNGRYFRMIGIG